jgi:hypothetical protein
MTSKIDDIDLEEALNSGAYHPEGTTACSSTYLKKFNAVVGCPAYIVGSLYFLKSNNSIEAPLYILMIVSSKWPFI